MLLQRALDKNEKHTVPKDGDAEGKSGFKSCDMKNAQLSLTAMLLEEMVHPTLSSTNQLLDTAIKTMHRQDQTSCFLQSS